MGRPKKPAPPWQPHYSDWSPPVGRYRPFVENPRATFVRNLRKILDQFKANTGYGLRRLSRLADLDYAHLRRIEKGKTYPGPETMQLLAELLGVKIEDFFRQDL